MKNRIFLVRYKRNSSPPQAIAYSDDGIEAVRDFFERAGDATHGTDWFIGFTEHGDFRATATMPTLKRLETSGVNRTGKYKNKY